MKVYILVFSLIFSILGFAQDVPVDGDVDNKLASLNPGEHYCYDLILKMNGVNTKIYNCQYKIKYAESVNQLIGVLAFDFYSEFIGNPLYTDMRANPAHQDLLMIKHFNKDLIDSALTILKLNDKLEKITKPVEINIKLQVFSIESSIVETFKLGLDKLTFGQGLGQDDDIAAGDGALKVGLKMGTAELSAFIGAERIKGNIQEIKTVNVQVNNRESFYRKLQMPVFFEFQNFGQPSQGNTGVSFTGTPSIDNETGDIYIRNLYLDYGILHDQADDTSGSKKNVENLSLSIGKKRIPKDRVVDLFSYEEKASSKSRGINLLSLNRTKKKSMRKLLILMSAEKLEGLRADGDIDPRLLPSHKLTDEEKALLPDDGASVQDFLNTFYLLPAFKKTNGNARMTFGFDKSLLTKENINKKVLVKFKGKGVDKINRKMYYDLEELAGAINYSPEIDLTFLNKNKSNVKLVIRERNKFRGAKIKKKIEFNPITSNNEKTFYIKKEKSRKAK